MLILLCTSTVCSSSRIELLLLSVKGIAFSEEVTRMKCASGQLGAAVPTPRLIRLCFGLWPQGFVTDTY